MQWNNVISPSVLESFLVLFAAVTVFAVLSLIGQPCLRMVQNHATLVAVSPETVTLCHTGQRSFDLNQADPAVIPSFWRVRLRHLEQPRGRYQ